MTETATETTPTDVGKPEGHPLVIRSAKAAWHMKEEGLKVQPHYDICPVVDFIVGEDIVLTAVPHQISRDNALAIIDIGVGPINPDLINLSVDAHVTQSLTNPNTGKAWGPNEMQNLCDSEGACSTGLLTDTIHTTGMFKDGTTYGMQRRYADHSKAGPVPWAAEVDYYTPQSKGQLGGYVTDRMAAAFQRERDTKAFDEMVTEGKTMGMSDAEMFWRRVCGAAQLMSITGAAGSIIVWAPDEYLEIAKVSLDTQRLADFAASLGPLPMMLAVKLGIE